MSITQRFKGKDWLRLAGDLLSFPFDDDKEYELSIKEYKGLRSKRANDYSWVLTNKLAEKMLICGVKLSKQEMHAEMIHRYGQFDLDDEGYPNFIKALSNIDVTEHIQYSFPEGVDEDGYTIWSIYRGSHTYNRSEMSLFIKGIVEECKEQGIETKTPEEIARMISLMKEER